MDTPAVDAAPKPGFPWPRILAEGAVIVVSILLAFAIDAWSAERAERQHEQVHLQRLASDLDAMRTHLRQTNEDGAKVVSELTELPARTGKVRGDREQTIVLGRLIAPRLVAFELFMPQLPTYSEMLATGSLSLLSSQDVLASLVRFQVAVGSTAAWNRWAEQETVTTMQPYVLQNMPYQPRVGSAQTSPDPTREPVAWTDDPRFWTLVAMRVETDEGMIRNRNKLLKAVDELDAAIAKARN